MAHSSYKVYLMKWDSEEEEWVDLIAIRDFPDLQGDPNMLDTTTLSDGEETQIPGIERGGEKKFIALYTTDDYEDLQDIEDAGEAIWIAVYFGEDGDDGMFEGKGYLSTKVLGKGVDEVLEMELTFAMVEPFEIVATATDLSEEGGDG